MKKRWLTLLALLPLALAGCDDSASYPLAHRMIFETDPDAELRIYVWLDERGEWQSGAYCKQGWAQYPGLGENIPSDALWSYMVEEEPVRLPLMGKMLAQSERESSDIQVRVLPNDHQPKENEWIIPDSHYFPYILDQLGLEEKKV